MKRDQELTAIWHPAQINAAQRAQVEVETRRYIARAEKLFALQLPRVEIRFDLSGRGAGMFLYKGKLPVIRYNPFLFAKYFEENLRDTTAHEVAHFAVFARHLQNGGARPKPHGEEWRQVMRAFGRDAKVTCRFDLRGIPQRQVARFAYRCACRTHAITAYRRNRIRRRQARYYCKHCNAELTPAATP